jgi:hypothetical protein
LNWNFEQIIPNPDPGPAAKLFEVIFEFHLIVRGPPRPWAGEDNLAARPPVISLVCTFTNAGMKTPGQNRPAGLNFFVAPCAKQKKSENGSTQKFRPTGTRGNGSARLGSECLLVSFI